MAAKNDESGAWTVAPSDESDRRDAPFVLEKIARFLEADDDAVFSDEDLDEVANAWRFVSGMIANKHTSLVPDAAWFLRVLLLPQFIGDSETSAAARVAAPALASLSGESDADETVQKMARVLDPTSPQVAQRMRILDVVRWSQSAGDTRADFLREKLGNIDERLRLDSETAAHLVRLFGRANGDRALAANWAWRSGIEGEPREGESKTGDAPPRIVEHFVDPEQKREKSRRARARS